MVRMFDLLSGLIPEDHSRQVTSSYMARYLLARDQAIEDVLDLGCGAGDSLDFFRAEKRGIRWVGLDIETSPGVASRTRTDGEFHTFDGVHMPFADNCFDLVYCNQVFEHVRYPLPLLKEIGGSIPAV